MWTGGVGVTTGGFQTSDQLTVTERFVKASDGKTLILTATLTDPVSLRVPLVLKHVWRWAPESKITPYEDCQIPTEVKRGSEVMVRLGSMILRVGSPGRARGGAPRVLPGIRR